jgi:hypothetical protein
MRSDAAVMDPVLECRTAGGSVYLITADGTVRGARTGMLLGSPGSSPEEGGRLMIADGERIVRTSPIVAVRRLRPSD